MAKRTTKAEEAPEKSIIGEARDIIAGERNLLLRQLANQPEAQANRVAMLDRLREIIDELASGQA